MKLFLAGFPCTRFSSSQMKNRITNTDFTAEEFIEFSKKPKWWAHIKEFESIIGNKLGIADYEFDIGLQLFINCVVAIDRLKEQYPNEQIYYLLENVASMQKSVQNVLSEILHQLYGGVMTEINSSLVSAQNRRRIYFTNWLVDQPEDRGILLKDILESGLTDKDKSYCLKHQQGNARDYFKKHHTQVAFENVIPINTMNDEGEKARTLMAGYYKYGTATLITNEGFKGGTTAVAIPVNTTIDGKSQCLRATCYKDGIRNLIANNVDKRTCVAEPIDINENEDINLNFICKTKKNKIKIIYEVTNKEITINGNKYPINLPDGYYIIRKLTPLECERLQTMPEGYTEGVSDTRRYQCLGNGWTAEIIIFILNRILNDASKDEEFIVLSMYDGIATGRYCLNKMGFTNIKYFAYEIDNYAKKIALKNYPDIIECGDAFAVREDNWNILENTVKTLDNTK